MQTTFPANESVESHSRIYDTLQHSREKLSDIGHTMTDKSKDIARSTDECVHRHAWKALGAMTLVGMTLGFLLHRR